jgi:hypothetical protein
MTQQIIGLLTISLFLFSMFHQDMPSKSLESARQKAGYSGPVRKVSMETENVSRKFYRETSNGERELIEDSTAQFGNGRFLMAEEEFDENGRLMADGRSERELEGEPFRRVYNYGKNGRLYEEDISIGTAHTQVGSSTFMIRTGKNRGIFLYTSWSAESQGSI